MDKHILLLFILTSSLVVITPGPNLLYIIARTAEQGWRAGVISVLGVDTGTLIYVLATATGLSALLVSSDLVFKTVKYAGAAYLIYLGLQALRTSKPGDIITSKKHLNFKRLYTQGLLTNLLNPKVALFFLSYLPQFVDMSQKAAAENILTLGMVFLIIGLAVDLAIVGLTEILGREILTKTSFVQMRRWISGGTFLVLGFSAAL